MAETLTGHPSDQSLLEYFDREAARGARSAVVEHLETCSLCRGRLEELQAATDEFEQFASSILRPALMADQPQWTPLGPRLRELEARDRRSRLRWLGVAAVGMAAAVLLVIVSRPAAAPQGSGAELEVRMAERSTPTITEVLTRSARAILSPQRKLRVSVGGRTFERPGIMSGDVESEPVRYTQALFVKARYSWEDPLSARSYRAWRDQLADRRDEVSVVDGAERCYRVTTATRSGNLRSASLMVRTADLRPVRGDFQFDGAGTVEIAETHRVEPLRESRAVKVLGPKETLSVLAALNRAGADSGEPIELVEEPSRERLLVRGTGVSAEVQRRIRDQVAKLPYVQLRFDSGDAAPSSGAAAGAAASTGIPAGMRQKLEQSFGGPAELQEATEQVLEASGGLLARAYALKQLADRLPPPDEERLDSEDQALLRSLKQQHAAAIREHLGELEQRLSPLGMKIGGAAGAGARPDVLLERAQKLNRLVSRLFAGSYSDADGRTMVAEVSRAVNEVRRAVGP